MALRHILKIKEKDTGKLIYRTQILGNNFFADDEFYNNLGLVLDNEDKTLEEKEIDVKKLFIEWVAFTRREFKDSDISYNFDNVLEQQNLSFLLFAYTNNVYIQILRVYSEMLQYLEEYKYEKIKENYVLTIEIG